MQPHLELHSVVSLGIEIENYFDAQSKLSREHLPKRSTQKPLFRRVCSLSPRREGNVRFPRSRHDRLNPRCFLYLGSIRNYIYRGLKNGARLILGKSLNFSGLSNGVLRTEPIRIQRGSLGSLANAKGQRELLARNDFLHGLRVEIVKPMDVGI